jgi:hypothetical protein
MGLINMNKKGNIFIIIFIILFVILSIVFFFRNSFLSIKEGITGTECPEGLIPDSLTLYHNDRSLDKNKHNFVYYISNLTFGDGQVIKPGTLSVAPCFKGGEEGENINNFYCKDIGYSSSKTDVSEDGVIGKTYTKQYTINLILSENNDQTQGEFEHQIEYSECLTPRSEL